MAQHKAFTRCILLAFMFVIGPSICHAIEFSDSFEKAFDDNPNQLPVVVTFGAPWCNWCRKLEYMTLMDEALDEIGDEYRWAKVNVDEQQDLAARFWIRGVPATIVFNSDGRPIGGRSGYMNPEELKEFLRESFANPQSPLAAVADQLHRLQFASQDEIESTVASLVEVLAQPDRYGREPILAALQARGDVVVPALLESMANSRLAVRAAAVHALQHVTGLASPFQPFDPLDARARQIESLRKEVGPQ